jgi:hypothetical protein
LAGRYGAALALLFCAHPALAESNPRKIAIGPASPKGALLFRVPALPIDYQLLLLSVDESGVPSRREWVYIKAAPLEDGDRFIVATFPPGKYLLEGVAQQSKWVACLHARTLTISIEPGRIAYLGTLDARPTLASIQRNANTPQGRIAHYGQWHFYRTNVAAPGVSDRDAGELARAEAFVRERMPRSSASAVLANLKWHPYALVGRSTRADRCI